MQDKGNIRQNIQHYICYYIFHLNKITNISIKWPVRLSWLENAYSQPLSRRAILTPKAGHTDLAFHVRSGFIISSVHTRLQVSVCSRKYLCNVNIQTYWQTDTHTQTFWPFCTNSSASWADKDQMTLHFTNSHIITEHYANLLCAALANSHNFCLKPSQQCSITANKAAALLLAISVSKHNAYIHINHQSLLGGLYFHAEHTASINY